MKILLGIDTGLSCATKKNVKFATMGDKNHILLLIAHFSKYDVHETIITYPKHITIMRTVIHCSSCPGPCPEG